jgi:DeoR/GlpR family transcriptional regulator of sugar metabolism
MLKEERQYHILNTLHRDGKVVAVELAAALNVSEDTIRRDLRDLAEVGKIQRVHGGALRLSPGTVPYQEREQRASAAKAALAHRGAQLVQNGQLIIIDGGTTTEQLARALPPDLRATVVTNSLPVGMALADHPMVDVIMVGGRLYKSALLAIGAETVHALQQFHADICFLGICSLHPELGITDLDYEETQVKRAMMNAAADVVALATADKLDTAAPYTLGAIHELTYLVTEAQDEARLTPYRQAGISVLVV